MNFTNHYRQLSEDYFIQIVTALADYSAPALGEHGHVELRELTDLANALLMGAEIAR